MSKIQMIKELIFKGYVAERVIEVNNGCQAYLIYWLMQLYSTYQTRGNEWQLQV